VADPLWEPPVPRDELDVPLPAELLPEPTVDDVDWANAKADEPARSAALTTMSDTLCIVVS
jgi:hypothetical protein